MSDIIEMLNEIDQKARSVFPAGYAGVGLLYTAAEDQDDDKPWVAWINSKTRGVIVQKFSDSPHDAVTKLLETMREFSKR